MNLGTQREAIILAGGLGTRLNEVVKELPKPMAPINDRPFLTYQLDYLLLYGIRRVILSVGYKYEAIESYFGSEYRGMEILYAVEKEPLGTGGAIAMALEMALSDQVLVLNGDTHFRVNYGRLWNFHKRTEAKISMVLRLVEDVDRFGSVDVDFLGVVRSFSEKGRFTGRGLINGGVYIIDKAYFKSLRLPEKCSFERDCLEIIYPQKSLFAMQCKAYFIDIGIPEDYETAQEDFKAIDDV